METASSDSGTMDPQTLIPPMDLNSLAQEAQEILCSMLPLLSFEAKLTPFIENNSIRIQVECKDAGRLIGRKGSTVNEIQFLLNRILQRRYKSLSRIFLDVGSGEQEVFDSEILTQAQSSADQVRRWGNPVEWGSLNPADRKAVQEMFAKDREIEVVNLEPNTDPAKPHRIQLQGKQKI